MATIKVEQGSINELKSAITFAAEQTSQAANMVSKAIDGMSGMSFSAKPGLESELTSLKNRLNQQARLSQSYCRAVQETVDALTQVDDSAGTSAEGVWRKATAISGAAVGSAVTAEGLSFFVKERLKKILGINGDFIDGASGAESTRTPNIIGGSAVSSVGGSSTTISADSVLHLSEYDWIRQHEKCIDTRPWNYGHPMISAKAKDITEDGEIIISEVKIARYNNYVEEGSSQNQVSCTYYTLRKLDERGLGYPFKTAGADGKDWYANCIESDSIPRVAGELSIETLAAQNGGTLNNVVVSFPATAENSAGHVMLIDKVFQDPSTGKTMVTFSDNLDWVNKGYLKDENGYTPECTWTLEYFKQTYITLNGGMNGAVLIGS